MPFDAPFHLGPFVVRQDGSLALATPQSRPRMHFQWRDCTVEVALHGSLGQGVAGELSLRAVVGRVPSTARIANDPALAGGAMASGAMAGGAMARGAKASGAMARRDAVFGTLRALPATLPAGWHAELLADHRVAVLSASAVEMPTTVDRLLTAVTLFLLALGPYLDVLGELGLEAPGMVKTWPG